MTLRFVSVGFVLLCIFASYRADNLPEPEKIMRQLHKPPQQLEISEAPFSQKILQKDYVITPRASYEFSGLVVSLSALDQEWFNIYYKDDPYNARDFCVIWGGNVVQGEYSRVEFWSSLWTCYFRHGEDVVFNPHELSNNHLLPADPLIADKLKAVEVGDQIRLHGFLVDYEMPKIGSMRRTSQTRTDTGEGACEVVYVTQFEFLRQANVVWRMLRDTTKWLTLIAFVATIVTYFLYDFEPPSL